MSQAKQVRGAAGPGSSDVREGPRLVGVVLQRELAVRLLDLPLGRAAVDVEDLIRVEVLVLWG